MDTFNQAEQKRLEGLYKAALDLYELVLADEADHVAALAGRGECLRMLGRYAEAVSAFDLALMKDPTWEFALSGKSMALNSLGRSGEVPGVWSSAGVHPTHADGWLALVDALLADGATHSALEIAREAADYHPDSAAIRGRVAEGYRMRGLHQVALMWAESALRRESREEVALMVKAMALNASGRFAEAEPVWRELAALAGEGSREVELGQEECRLAARWEDAAAVGAIADAEVSYRMASGFEQAGNVEAAMVFYDRCLALAPTSTKSLLGRGNALRLLGRTEDAATTYRAVLASRPEDPFALAGLADCDRLEGRLADALEGFDHALSLAPTNSVAVMGKAATLNQLGRFDDAFPLWTLALELDPGSDFARDGDATCRAGRRGKE